MRRALGLGGTSSSQPTQQRPEAARTRHRFVQDGEVPVVLVSGMRAPEAGSNGRGGSAHAALEAERTARANAERSLAEALATIQSLRTKLVHAELSHGEALAAERRGREQAEAALQDALAARGLAEQRLSETAAAQPPDAPAPRPRVKRAASVKSAPRAPGAKGREPKPVKWWLPDYKATTKDG